MNGLPSRSSVRRGQSLVELALTLSVLIILLAGIIDFGVAYFSYVALRDAAEEGAVYGAMCPTDLAGIEERIRQSSSSPVNLADTTYVTVTIQSSRSNPQPGDVLQITVAYRYLTILPFLAGNSILLRAQVTAVVLTSGCAVP
jgi:Flp pilus assembly protein TadG